MDKLSKVKAASENRKKVLDWLDKIGETDEACRAEVLDQCAKDPEARAYYVARSEEEF